MMSIRRAFLVSLLALGLLTSNSARAQLEFPQPKGWVNDFAGIINAKVKKRLTAVCVELDRKTNAQISVVTIDSTEGTPVGDYAHLLFNKWGIGHKEDNRGILVLLSVKDHTYYIAVGRGLEVLFPNDRVAGIGAEMVPDLRGRRYAKAVRHTVDGIASIIGGERGVTINSAGPGSAH
jgi:uncharacterized protein